MDQSEIPALLDRIRSDDDAMRKMAVFKLQSSINDPSFSYEFISSGGLNELRKLIMITSGNTLAYSLQSLTRLLEVDMGWDVFESPGSGELVERVVELIVTHPLVNILRGAMSILVAVVSHSQSSGIKIPGAFGFRALKPAVAVYPHFFEMVVSQLNSADHALCANALMLLNALMRDAVTNDTSNGGNAGKDGKSSGSAEEWPKFIKRLQDLGVMKTVYTLMQSSALQDLAHPLLEFQVITKVLLRKWRDVKVDLERPEHRRALKGLHLSSAPERKDAYGNGGSTRIETLSEAGKKSSKRHNPEKWRRLGFETESPAWEFDHTGFLGMMDLTDFVRKQEDEFQKILLEQSSRPMQERCPIARASLAATSILYEHFEIDKADVEDAKSYHALDGMRDYDKIFKPTILQWSRLHNAALHAFFRLWRATGADKDDFDNVGELVRILIDQVVGNSPRTKDVQELEDDLRDFEYSRLRELQMELLDLNFEDEWGSHLLQIREELKHEALQFVKEQRIRCLLSGAWFPKPFFSPQQNQASISISEDQSLSSSARHEYKGKSVAGWRYVQLSSNRRYLHYLDFEEKANYEPSIDQLTERIDLSTVSSVVSNVSATTNDDTSSISSTDTPPTNHTNSPQPKSTPPVTTTRITINTFVSSLDHHSRNKNHDRNHSDPPEKAVLTLSPQTHSLASEWLDGLLMLLNQAPITAETTKLIQLVSGYGLKIRLLNVRAEEVVGGLPEGVGIVPSREGLDEDYYYENAV